MKTFKIFLCSLALAYVLVSCADADGDFPGSEYMPDMAHSIAQEANVVNDYYYNTWDEQSVATVYELANINRPVEGTVPRGYAGIALNTRIYENGILDDELERGYAAVYFAADMNAYAPYYYENSEEGRLQAIAGLQQNPFPITEEGLNTGKELYVLYCAICHGEAGDGLGYLYDTDQNPNAKYIAAPASFLRDEYLAASNGRYYHAIMYGYNVMGSYADKLNYEERWQVIHYIRSLQAAETEMEYSAEANTLNVDFGTPSSDFDPTAVRELPDFSGQAAGSATTEITTEVTTEPTN